MSAPQCLIALLDEALPNLKGGERDLLAEQIVETLSDALGRKFARAIAGSAQCVLTSRELEDGDGLSRELGNNSAMAVLAVLSGIDA